jgi:hypothetical protein
MMVILLRAYKVTEEGHAFGGAIIKKWDNDTTFNFDMSNYDAWKRFLSNAVVNGKPLPRSSKHGHKVAYRVYSFGGTPPTHDYFPGKDSAGNKRYLLTHGQLTPLKGEKK